MEESMHEGFREIREKIQGRAIRTISNALEEAAARATSGGYEFP